MKILNLYAGIGGNRKLWPDEHDITAVELNPDIAKIYNDFFPNDKMIIGDAHQYLLEHYEEDWGFIWSSPPCPTHSRIRNIAGVGCRNVKPVYIDMKLYQEIIFLQQIYNSSGCFFKGRYVIENVRSYYKPLVTCQEVGMHYFWANFYISRFDMTTRGHFTKIEGLQKLKGINIEKYDINNKEVILKNCIQPELGLHILNESQKGGQQTMFG